MKTLKAKCGNCDNNFVDVKVRGHFHINEKYSGAAHRYRNVNVSLNYKVSIVFHILKIMMHIILCKNWEKSILKYMSHQMD